MWMHEGDLLKRSLGGWALRELQHARRYRGFWISTLLPPPESHQVEIDKRSGLDIPCFLLPDDSSCVAHARLACGLPLLIWPPNHPSAVENRNRQCLDDCLVGKTTEITVVMPGFVPVIQMFTSEEDARILIEISRVSSVRRFYGACSMILSLNSE